MRKLTVTVGLSLSVQAVALFCHLFILDEKKKIILTLFHPLVFINASVETPVTVQECFFVAYSFLTTFLINCTSMITFFIVSIKMWENHHRNKIECSSSKLLPCPWWKVLVFFNKSYHHRKVVFNPKFKREQKEVSN